MSLTSDQTLVPNKSAIENPEESVEIAPISEAFVSGKDQSNDSIESYIASLNQFTSPTSVIPISLQVTPLSCTSPALSSISTLETTPFSSSPITAEAAVFHVDSVTHDEATTEESDPIKLESLVKHLKESMFQVLHSADIGPQ
ncbi:unnamed protein product [Lactuca virosa]|uniref:Uncharacterized protein n=1 Tax=Lactuca virosa TaxID=75947 RepID=A0AAU9PLL8_9ASTR|nr:unnamed protein product [Lactuca virosa]